MSLTPPLASPGYPSNLARTNSDMETYFENSQATEYCQPQFGDFFQDCIFDGFSTWTNSGLSATLGVGPDTNAIIITQGNRISIPLGDSRLTHTYTASQDTYLDISPDAAGGVGTVAGNFHYSSVANNAAAPAIYTNSLRIAKIVTGASAVTSVTWLAPSYFALTQSLYGAASITLSPLATPTAPTVMPTGTTGSASATYQIVALLQDGTHSPASTAGATSTSNATLTGSNYNVIAWTAVPGATAYAIYRNTSTLTSPTSLGKIATTNALTINDTGLTGDTTTAPTTNNTAILTKGNGSYASAGADELAIYSNGNSGSSPNIVWDNGNVQSITINAAATFTFTAPSHPGKFMLIITQDSSGHAYSFPTMKYPGGIAPTYSTAANAIDILTIVYTGSAYLAIGNTAFA